MFIYNIKKNVMLHYNNDVFDKGTLFIGKYDIIQISYKEFYKYFPILSNKIIIHIVGINIDVNLWLEIYVKYNIFGAQTYRIKFDKSYFARNIINNVKNTIKKYTLTDFSFVNNLLKTDNIVTSGTYLNAYDDILELKEFMKIIKNYEIYSFKSKWCYSIINLFECLLYETTMISTHVYFLTEKSQELMLKLIKNNKIKYFTINWACDKIIKSIIENKSIKHLKIIRYLSTIDNIIKFNKHITDIYLEESYDSIYELINKLKKNTTLKHLQINRPDDSHFISSGWCETQRMQKNILKMFCDDKVNIKKFTYNESRQSQVLKLIEIIKNNKTLEEIYWNEELGEYDLAEVVNILYNNTTLKILTIKMHETLFKKLLMSKLYKYILCCNLIILKISFPKINFTYLNLEAQFINHNINYDVNLYLN